MNYNERIDRVVNFIGKNFDKDLDLDTLCQVACFSKYHFHRLFTAYCGISLKAYIKWLKLKRAAHQLTVSKDGTIINIALNAGFESHESFSRAFKKVCGQSPSHFKNNANWTTWENPPFFAPIKGKNIMEIKIKELPSKRLAVIEHHGDPLKLTNTLDKLISWAKEQPIDLKPKAGEAFGLGYHDPRDVSPEDFRFDLALSIPEDFKLHGPVFEKRLPAGRYAVAVHKGSRDTMGDTAYAIYHDWLSKSGEELADFPCIFCYYNFDHEVAETELLTEVRLLLK